MEDQQIIELYCRREQDAVVQTKQKYERYCGMVAKNILYSKEDVEECLNDTWLRTWNSIPPQRPSRFRVFLGTITRNLSIDKYRALHSKSRGEGTMEVVLEELLDCVSGETVESHMDHKELVESLNKFLKKQSKDHRVIFVRRYWYMDTTKDIATRMAMSEGKVKTILFRMRKKLRFHLAEEGIVV